MMKFYNNGLDDEDQEEMQMPMVPQPKFLTIARNDDRSRVEAHVKGTFDAPRNNVYEIGALYDLSDKYDTVVVYINSEGGRIDMLSELVSVIRKFKTVITVGAGQVNSAAFMLWCVGDIRVVQDYTIFMAHRESYRMSGKTDQHVELANFNQRIFSKTVDDFFKNVLTSDEMEKIRHSEVFLSGDDLIERECAISWDHFVEGSNRQPNDIITILQFGDEFWMPNGHTMTEVMIDFGGPVYKEHDIVYNVPNAVPIWSPEEVDDDDEVEPFIEQGEEDDE